MTLRAVFASAGLACSLLLSGCGEEEVSSIRITLKDDLSGTLSSRSVTIPSAANPPAVEGATQGVTWGARGEVVMATGTFADLSALKIADITFECDGKNPMAARVLVPRGPQAQWPKLLTVTDRELRERTAAALAPEVKRPTAGSVLTIAVKLPPGMRAVTSGVKGLGRGLNATMESTLVTLTVPVEVALGAGQSEPNKIVTEPLSWHFTWEKDTPAGK
ncbi:MAG: hypothetical protein ACT4PL_07100 [Phycisphaerales bacterium]